MEDSRPIPQQAVNRRINPRSTRKMYLTTDMGKNGMTGETDIVLLLFVVAAVACGKGDGKITSSVHLFRVELKLPCHDECVEKAHKNKQCVTARTCSILPLALLYTMLGCGEQHTALSVSGRSQNNNDGVFESL
jgi:hypothetical protein